MVQAFIEEFALLNYRNTRSLWMMSTRLSDSRKDRVKKRDVSSGYVKRRLVRDSPVAHGALVRNVINSFAMALPM
jgi:hypothetical protein